MDVAQNEVERLERELGHLRYVLDDGELRWAPLAARPGVDWVRRVYEARYVERYWRWYFMVHARVPSPHAATPETTAPPARVNDQQPARPAIQHVAPTVTAPVTSARPATQTIGRAPRAAFTELEAGAPSVPVRERVRTSWFSARAFFTDHAILILSYLGAFLLLVATLLFELYSGQDLRGPARFAAVLAVDAVFAVAAWACMRRESLRIVGRTYTAVFALLTPLMLAAAQQFLGLGDIGIHPALAVAVGGASCAVLYARLATGLRSTAYAALSLIAVLAGALGWAGIVGMGRWTGLEMMPVAVFFTAIAKAHGEPWRRAARFGRVADVLAYVVSAGALVTAVVTASSDNGSTLAPELPCVLAAVAVTQGLAGSLGRRLVDLVIALVSAGAALVAASQTLGTGYDGAALTLSGVGLVLVTLTPWLLPGSRRRGYTSAAWVLQASRGTTALLLITSASLPVPDAWAQITVIVAAVLGAFTLALQSAEDAWLLVGLTALAGQVVTTAYQPGFAVSMSAPRYPFIPIGLGALTAATAIIGLRARSSRLALAVAAGVSATTLTMCASLGASTDVTGWSLVGLGAIGALAARVWQSRIAGFSDIAMSEDHLLLLRVAAAVHLVTSAGLVLSPDPASIGLLLVVVTVGFELAASTRQAWWLTTALAALSVQLYVLAEGPSGFVTAGELPRLAQIPITLTGLTVAAAVFAYRTRQATVAVAVAVGIAAAVVGADHTLAVPFWIGAVELVPLALSGAIVARRFDRSTGLALRVVAALELVASGGLVWHPDLAAVTLLAAIVTVTCVLAADTREATWLLAGLGALGTQLAALGAAGDLASPPHAPVLLVVPCTLTALTVALVVVERWWTRQGVIALLPPPMVLATAMTATFTAQGDVDAYAAVLVGLAVVGAVASVRTSGLAQWIVITATVTTEVIGAASLPVSTEAMRIVVLGGAVFAAFIFAVRGRRPEWLTMGVVALAAQTIAVSAVDGSVPAAPFIPATLSMLTIATAACAVLLRRTDLVTWVKLGATLSVLTAERTFNAGADAYAVALLLLGWGYILGSLTPLGRRQQIVTRIGGVAHVIAAGVVATTPAELSGGLMIAAAAAVTVVAVAERRPELQLLATSLLGGAWFWLVAPGAEISSTPYLVIRSYIALAPLFLAVGASVRIAAGSARGWRWAFPWYASGMFVTVGVILGAATLRDSAGVATMLMVGGAALYGAALVERSRRESVIAAGIACLAMPSGIALQVAAAGAAPEWTTVIFSASAAVIAVARIPIRAAGGDPWLSWDSAHSLSALLAATAGVAAAVSVPSVAQSHTVAPVLAFGSTIFVAVLLRVEARLRLLRGFDYVALIVAGCAPLWLAAYAGFSNPQAYVVTPSLAAIAVGLLVDRAASTRVHRVYARAAVGMGAGVLLGVSGLQALTLLSGDANDIFLLLSEALIAVVAGIGLGNRTLVIAGSAGILAAAIRALQEIVAAVPLYAVFGGAALTLLAVAWGLTVARDRWSLLRQELRGSWQQWT